MKLPVGSYTFYNNFENCPHKAWHMYVLKDLPRVESKEMKWGNDVHKALEERIRDATPLPETMAAAEPLAAMVHALKDDCTLLAEEKLGIDAQGRAVDFFADNVWFRGKMDVTVVKDDGAWILDWKTGKPREEPMELETNALLVKARWPHLEKIEANYFWLQTGKSGLRYTCDGHSRVFGKLQALENEMQGYAAKGEWPKRKNPLCGWCPVTACENNTSHRRTANG
jgi:hypothetical protein